MFTKKNTPLILLTFIITTALSFSCSKNYKYSLNDAPFHILDFNKKHLISYEKFINKLAQYQIVFIGELHNKQFIHDMELSIIKDIYKNKIDSNKKIIISMEMFDQDVQKHINLFLNNKSDTKTFIKNTKAWSNYLKAYHPIILFAKKYKIKILAMNTPRDIRRQVVKQGTKSFNLIDKNFKPTFDIWNDLVYEKYFFDSFPAQAHLANTYNRFLKNFFYASILKDFNMASAIVNSIKDTNYTLISINGKFHSDYSIAIPNLIRKIADANSIPTSIASVSFVTTKKYSNFYNNYSVNAKIADFILFNN